MKISIAIGADHRGFEIKQELVQQPTIARYDIDWHNVGAFNHQRSDYPLFASQVVNLILQKEADYGILLCGTGTGMAIMANRFDGIYAGVVWNEEVARRAREEDGVNVLCLPTDYLNKEQSMKCIEIWLTATFKGGRYQERLDLITELRQDVAP